MEKYLQFKQEDELNTNLYVYGNIIAKDWYSEDPEVNAFDFKEAIANVKTPNLTVRINSMGGSVSEGLAIYNLLNDYEGNLITKVDGFACSAASVIFMAGKERIVPEGGLLMIHNAWSSAQGDSNDLKKAAEDLEKITEPSINIYSSKTGIDKEQIKEMMDKETWLTAEESLELGFATEIEQENVEQSVVNTHINRMVGRIKELEHELNHVEEQKGNNKDKSSWDGFFN